MPTDETDIENSPEDCANLVMNLANKAGMLILENGAETYRAEETVMLICRAGGFPLSEAFALPTGLFVTLIAEDGKVCEKKHIKTTVNRVKKHDINLSKIEQTNNISRQFVSGKITADQAYEELNSLDKKKNSGRWYTDALIASAATAFFTMLYGGGLFDCIIAAVCGITVHLLSCLLKKTDIYRLAISLLGGMVIALITVISKIIFRFGNIDSIIIGGIIPLLPGLAMTNAIRETITGDLVSGVSRFAEVILTAVALAGGVGTVLSVYILMGGTV